MHHQRLLTHGQFQFRTTGRDHRPGTLDPWQRLAGEDPADWNRYDTPGSTVYLSENDEIAFAEVLSSYALKLGMKHPLQKDADFMGIPLEGYFDVIDGE